MKPLFFIHLSLFQKLVSISLATGLITICIVAVLIIPKIEKNILNERKTALKNVVESAYSIVKDYGDRAAKGLIKKPDAVERVKNRFQALKYGRDNREYFFIVRTKDTTMVVHPMNPELDGTIVSGIKGLDGKFIFAEMAALAEQRSSGFIPYQWTRPGSAKAVSKLTYVRYYEPWGWAVGSGLYMDDVTAKINQIKAVIYLAILASTLISFIITLYTARLISVPLKQSVEFAQQVAQGNLSFTLDIRRKDEAGVLAKALNHMVNSLGLMLSELLATSGTINSSATELAAVSKQMSAKTGQSAENCTLVSDAARHMTDGMAIVASATEHITDNIQTIGSATEEMSKTINGIAQDTAAGRRTTAQAVETMRKVSLKICNLDRAALEISQITEAIADISDQTNLLALNASVEAARAGKAGRGFTVVAAEIKHLAKQAAEATGEINAKITGIQSTTRESVTAIKSIVTVVNKIDEIVSSVDGAIEKQSSATEKISSNISQVALGLGKVNENATQAARTADHVFRDISLVNEAAEEISAGSEQVKASAHNLSGHADTLNRMVTRFKL